MRVLAVDDHALFRRCMVDYLTEQNDITVVGEASKADYALELAQQFQPDLALVDIDLGGQCGYELATKLRERCPSCAIVILTASEDEAQMLRAVRIGAKGYIVKDVEPEQLVTALRRVSEGEEVFSRDFLFNQLRTALDSPTSSSSGGTDDRKQLTTRELEVLQLVTDGMIDKQVAVRLSLSENTVKNHMKNIRRKLGASNRAQATSIGLQMGLIRSSRFQGTEYRNVLVE